MTKSNYIFGEALGNAMTKVSIRTQLEASMMSMAFMLVGFVIFGIYFVIYNTWAWWIKTVTVVNLLAGMVMMISFLITTFQQYRVIMDAQKIQEEMKNNEK